MFQLLYRLALNCARSPRGEGEMPMESEAEDQPEK